MTRAVVTIGNFDGVHRGHQAVLGGVARRARELGLPSFAVTFRPHPQRVLFPERDLSTLTTWAERVALIRACGIDAVWVCHFSPRVARMSPEEFLLLVEQRQPIQELWVGSDFAMGHDRLGTHAVLAEIGRARGWDVRIVPPLRDADGTVVSSSAIREALSAGAVDRAAHLLGRPYRVCGETLAEEDDGWSPLRVPGERAVPGPGLYAGRLQQGAYTIAGLISVRGTRGEHVIRTRGIDSSGALESGPSCADFVELLRSEADEGSAVGAVVHDEDLDRARAIVA